MGGVRFAPHSLQEVALDFEIGSPQWWQYLDSVVIVPSDSFDRVAG